MSIKPIGSTTEVNLYMADSNSEDTDKVNLHRFAELPQAASVTAVPIETAKAEVLAAPFLGSMMMPSADGIYSIGSVSIKKTAAAVGAISSMRGFSSWGF